METIKVKNIDRRMSGKSKHFRTYRITVTTAKKMDENWNYFEKELQNTIKKFNEISKIARKPKEILNYSINGKLLILDISSFEPIDSLRHLWSFCKILKEETPLLYKYCANKRFLKLADDINEVLNNGTVVNSKDEKIYISNLNDKETILALNAIYLNDNAFNKLNENEKNLLNSLKADIKKLTNDFLNDVPFSKFYLK